MLQTTWPPATMFEPSPQPQSWTTPNFTLGAPGGPGATDGVTSPWYGLPSQSGFGTPGFSPMQGLLGGLMSLMQSLMALLGNLLSSATAQSPPGAGPQQQVQDATLSSTGDPHLAETGTTATGPVDQHFDSMSAHGDLLHSSDIAGGYRVSTTVGAPNANGVTTNSSATVHTAFGQDQVTMRKDGTFSITDRGQAVALTSGQTVTLSGGATVTQNNDGSLVVSAANGNGGTIATTLRAAGGSEVDVTTQAHAIGVGGDIVRGIATPQRRAL